MNNLMQEERFDIVSPDAKAFKAALDDKLTNLGYDYGGKIARGNRCGTSMIRLP